jgi:hypothetical protein
MFRSFRSRLGVLVAALALSSTALHAVNFSSSFSENFNSMGTAGTTPPPGWSVKVGSGGSNSTWTTTIPGTGANSVVAMVAATGGLTATTTPSATNVNGYNAAAAPGNTADRTLVMGPTGITGCAIQLQLTNTSGAAITGLGIGYDIRRLTAVSSANELPGFWLFYSLDGGTTWTNVAALNPTLAGPSGIVVPNTVGVTNVPVTNVDLSSAWNNGTDLLLRWVDDNAVATSPDQFVGLDNVSITITSGGVVVGNPPSVTLTNPTAGSTFAAPATIHLAATATETDGTIAKVEFYSGATKLGEATAEPFAFDWTGVTAGTYALTAAATDNDNNRVVSSAVSVTVTPPPGSGTLTRGPYLQKAAPTRMTIRWRSSQSVIGLVRYGTDVSNLAQSVSEASATTEHVMELTDLIAGVTYFYSIGSSFDTLASGADYTFTTSPVPGSIVNTRIWVLGDAGTANSSQRAVRDAFYAWTGTRTPNFVLELGDNAYNSGTDTEFQGAVFDMYPTMLRKTPFWSCLGNHETDQATAFVDTYPYFNIYTFPTAGESGGVASGTEHYYSFDYGNIHVISLDSMTANRAPNGAMATWLQNDLASTTATWIIAIFHHPPYTKGSHNSDTESELVQMRQNILPILEAGGVDLVLGGHSHAYERSYLLDGHYGLSTTLTSAMKVDAGDGRVGGTGAYMKPLTGPRDHLGAVYTVAGSSGQTSGGSLNHPAHFISLNNLGSLVLDINGNQVNATFLRENGTTPDTFSLIKQGATDKDHDGLPDDWELTNGADRTNAGDVTADRDGDMIGNGLEYALGTPGNMPNRNGLPVVAAGTGADAGKLTFTFNRLRPELSYIVQGSDDLKSWTNLATNPGSAGSAVTYVDPNTTSPNHFLRLSVTVGTSTFTTVPAGRLTYALPQNQETAVSFPLNLPLDTINGQPAGFITGVTATTISNANAGWIPGALSQAAVPFFLRITSGAATGRLFPIATAAGAQNTATQLTLVTDGIDLTTLGLSLGSDTYELVPADTLANLFPAGTLQAGTVDTADTLRLWAGTDWVTYFFDGTHWQRDGGGLADDTLIRPQDGWMLRRRGPALNFVLIGQVSSTNAKVPVARSASTYLSLLPVSQTFNEFALQNVLPGWSSNPANVTAGDYVRIWSGAAWFNYYYSGTKWLRQGSPLDSGTTVLLKPGRPFFIVRPAGTGADLLQQTKSY